MGKYVNSNTTRVVCNARVALHTYDEQDEKVKVK